MYCLTRYEMRFGDIVVPARTKCMVINEIRTDTVDAPGVYVRLLVKNSDVKLNVIKNKNKVIQYNRNVNNAVMCGLVLDTDTTAVYMDASDKIYYHTGIYDWQLEKIFGKDKVPRHLILGKYEYNGKDASLESIIDYLEDEFSEWVQENCDFYTLTEKDIENGEGFDEAEVGDKILSDEGLIQFYKKQLEYQNKIETIGFTYEFSGGLIWD